MKTKQEMLDQLASVKRQKLKAEKDDCAQLAFSLNDTIHALRDAIRLNDPTWSDPDEKEELVYALDRNHPLNQELEQVEAIIRHFHQTGRLDLARVYFDKKDQLEECIRMEAHQMQYAYA